MQLTHLRLVSVGPFDDARMSFSSAASDASPRKLVLLYGSDGVGKTTVLSAVAGTRPGHASVPLPSPVPWASAMAVDPPCAPPAATAVSSAMSVGREGGAEIPPSSPYAVATWWLGDDDLARPHGLIVASPNAPLDAYEDDAAGRREQAFFDKRAGECGYSLVAFSGARWFSRTPAVLSAPHRTLLRHDVRAAASFDDPSRADLSRDTKQVLLFAKLEGALRVRGAPPVDNVFERALDVALATALAPFDTTFAGVHAATYEPVFHVDGRAAFFDALPRRTRHIVAFVTLTLKALHAANGSRNAGSVVDPREREGVALVDDAELHMDEAGLRELPRILRASLPRVQWIMATSSKRLAMSIADEAEGWVVALRRGSSNRAETSQRGNVVITTGDEALLQ